MSRVVSFVHIHTSDVFFTQADPALMCPACFYYCGFVSFPTRVVDNFRWSMMGGWFILAIMALSAYILFICLFVKYGVKAPDADADGISMVDGTPSN